MGDWGYCYISQLGETFYQGMRKSLTISTFSISIIQVKEYTLNDKSKNEIQGFISTQKETVYPTASEDEKTEGKCQINIDIGSNYLGEGIFK